MKKLCKHDVYKTIDDIFAPRYHDQKVLINVNKVSNHIEHYLVKFSKAPAYADWLYFSGQDIRKSPTQKNGGGTVYVVELAKHQAFDPVVQCEHLIK